MLDKDFIVYNMPAIMGRKAWVLNEAGGMKPDETWHASVRETYFFLFKFFQDNGLVVTPVVQVLSDTASVVLRFGDLTPEGQAFVMSQAPHRWEASFDRPGSKKKLNDVSYLEKQLKKMRAER